VRVWAIVPIGFFITSIALPAWTMLLYWMAIQFVSGVTGLFGNEAGGVAFWAHVGGFVAGVVLIKLFARPADVMAHRGQAWRPPGRVREGWGA
jgi:membrane associated rhomboid family serine protease